MWYPPWWNLGITNNIKDYSVSEGLLGEVVERDWNISFNDSGYVTISDDTILEVGSGSQYLFMDRTNRSLNLNVQ